MYLSVSGDNIPSHSVVLIFCVSSKVTKCDLMVVKLSNAARCC